MNLEDIGFYTLTNSRAEKSSINSPLWRCELILTSKCNFSCPYCRGVSEENQGSLSLDEAKRVLNIWCAEGLRNVRFSGGEPTLWKPLPELVAYAKRLGVSRIAISTNGSANFSLYQDLISAGVNDFSISLDACCAETGDRMAGRRQGSWDIVVKNIQNLSLLTYVTVGVVLTPDNIDEFYQTVMLAHELGVDDIRIIPSAQWNKHLRFVIFPQDVLDAHPILKYRMTNLNSGRHVRGISSQDNYKCPLVLDDMAVLKGYHYPCIIYLREQGPPIGRIDSEVRIQRDAWWKNHDCYQDPICRNNCLDVCIDYNNKHHSFNLQSRVNSSLV